MKRAMTALILWVALPGLMLLSAGSVFAQEEEKQEDKQKEKQEEKQQEDAAVGYVEKVAVTGTHIPQDPNLTGVLPVQTIESEHIQMSGEFALSDVVNDVPALLSSVTSEQSMDSGAAFDDGANVLNLRGLGVSRTLVLVDGRRHVGGLRGSSAVDVGSIPMKLVERIEVLSGGASAIYGADAVTGVVNFIMKDDFEGFTIDLNHGISSQGDAQQRAITATWGRNFAGARGNIAVSVDYRVDQGLTMGDRPGESYGTGGAWVNPALRFQQGDISGGTPLFQQYYNYNNTGLFNFGLPIPDAAGFVADYNTAFPGTPITEADLNAAELALIDQAATAPPRAVHADATFPFTSAYGYVVPGNPFTFNGFDPGINVDLDGNGTPDCLDSFHAYNSVFGAASFGVVGGCWVVDADGGYSPVQDGLVSGNFQGFGGSSTDVRRQDYFDYLLPDDKVSVNVMGHYDLTGDTSFFGEVKYVTQEVSTRNDTETFWDLIYGAPDNPFVPAWLQTEAAAWGGGVAITIDPLAFDSVRSTDRDTVRVVLGLEGKLDSGWRWEVAANYGRFEQKLSLTNDMLVDRWFAAVDATTDPATGQAVCRSSLDPTAAPLNTPFEIPSYEAGYFSFTPGDGQCQPLNIWAGRTGLTQEALDFVFIDSWHNTVIDQFVISAFMTGDSSRRFELPAGPIAFAFGAEYRDESSDSRFDPLSRGVIPGGSPFLAGSNVGDVSANTSLTFRPQLAKRNEKGGYDVADIYVESSVPLLADVPLARKLTLGLAARLSDYSTIGQTTTWKTNLLWAPIDSLTFRASFSEAVRAPNITELFAPEIGATFRPADPCDATQIAAIRVDNPTLADQTQANCVTVFEQLGLNTSLYIDPVTNAYIFADPLSASFGGLTSGNRNLTEETAETFTAGVVFQPEFARRFSLTLDYWDISIDNAIEAVSSQNIVDGCYQGSTLNLAFCDLFERNTDNASAQAGGLNFLQQTKINFARVESNGIDFAVTYAFDRGNQGFDVRLQGTSVNSLNLFQNPLDLTEVNPELGELNRPEFAGNVFLNWRWGDFRVGWQSQYLHGMLYGGIEVETAQTLYGPTVFQDPFWQHDLNARYALAEGMLLYGGVKNITGETPFLTQNAFPASPRGTVFFLGIDWKM